MVSMLEDIETRCIAIEMINYMEVKHCSIINNTVEWILVEDDVDNRQAIEDIGIIGRYHFNIGVNSSGGYINIAELGFEFSNYWSKSTGFDLV